MTLSGEHDLANGARGGYIVRTAAQGAPLEALHADMLYLQRMWAHVRERAAATTAGNLVHEDLPLSTRVLRDELRPEVRRVLVDSVDEFARMREFTARLHARVRRIASSCTRHRARSSTCMASRKRSVARWINAWR